MAASAAMWNNAAPGSHPLPGAFRTPATTQETGSSSDSKDSSSTISANDFLTLLVTEMKNQDPTSATDPNQYINQLVSVNSLEQLIQINQTLSAAVVAPDVASGGSNPPSREARSDSDDGLARQLSGAGQLATLPAARAPQAHITSGNLGIPDPAPAAERVAQALAGRTHLR